MKLGFEECQSFYSSGSRMPTGVDGSLGQRVGLLPALRQCEDFTLPTNSPLADLYYPAVLCGVRTEEPEGKIRHKGTGRRVQDRVRAFRTSEQSQPVAHELRSQIPCGREPVHHTKHLFVREIIEERKPLAVTARPVGWIGSKILLDRVPDSGKIHIVRGSVVRAKGPVLAEWQRRAILRNKSPETRGWLLNVIKRVESLGKREFTLDEIYAFDGISAILSRQPERHAEDSSAASIFARSRIYRFHIAW